jgi:hypothetical protein
MRDDLFQGIAMHFSQRMTRPEKYNLQNLSPEGQRILVEPNTWGKLTPVGESLLWTMISTGVQRIEADTIDNTLIRFGMDFKVWGGNRFVDGKPVILSRTILEQCVGFRIRAEPMTMAEYSLALIERLYAHVQAKDKRNSAVPAPVEVKPEPAMA